jgi:hypothetical protein
MRRKVICVRMSFNQPIDVERIGPDILDDPVGGLEANAAGRVIDVHDTGSITAQDNDEGSFTT